MKRLSKIAILCTATLLLALCLSSVAVAQTIPLQSGKYVLKTSQCADAPNAAILLWDGVGFGSAHSTGCTSRAARRPDGRYDVATACTAQGDGSPNPSGSTFEESIILTRISSTRFVVTKPTGVPMSYRWCSVR